MKIRTIIVKFNTEIKQHEVPLFRGAVNAILDEGHSILFHNHTENGFRFAYPLIQYKRIGGKAAIVCVGDGADAIGEFFSKSDNVVHIADRNVEMEVDTIEAKRTIVQVWDEEFKYIIRKWLPLNSDNYVTYRQQNGIAEQCAFLEKILVGNILSFCKGLNITIDKDIKCIITNILDNRLYYHKGVKMMGVDIEFKSNVSLPDYVGLGKGVSMGFGTIIERKKDKLQ